MKKEYCVYVDVTMAGNYYVEAESEEQAKNKVRDMFKSSPYEQARKAEHYVGMEMTDVTEC